MYINSMFRMKITIPLRKTKRNCLIRELHSLLLDLLFKLSREFVLKLK